MIKIEIRSACDSRTYMELESDRTSIELTLTYNEGEDNEQANCIILDYAAAEELEAALSAMRYLLKQDD